MTALEEKNPQISKKTLSGVLQQSSDQPGMSCVWQVTSFDRKQKKPRSDATIRGT